MDHQRYTLHFAQCHIFSRFSRPCPWCYLPFSLPRLSSRKQTLPLPQALGGCLYTNLLNLAAIALSLGIISPFQSLPSREHYLSPYPGLGFSNIAWIETERKSHLFIEKTFSTTPSSVCVCLRCPALAPVTPILQRDLIKKLNDFISPSIFEAEKWRIKLCGTLCMFVNHPICGLRSLSSKPGEDRLLFIYTIIL